MLVKCAPVCGGQKLSEVCLVEAGLSSLVEFSSIRFNCELLAWKPQDKLLVVTVCVCMPKCLQLLAGQRKSFGELGNNDRKQSTEGGT